MSNKKVNIRIEFLASIILTSILLGFVFSWGVMIETGWLTREISIIEHAIRMQCCFISMVGCMVFMMVSIIWWVFRELAMRGTPQVIPVQENSMPFNVIADKKSVVIATC